MTSIVLSAQAMSSPMRQVRTTRATVVDRREGWMDRSVKAYYTARLTLVGIGVAIAVWAGALVGNL